jgi:hypothetical protein
MPPSFKRAATCTLTTLSFALVAGLMTTAPAAAACNATISSFGVTPVIVFDPFQGVPAGVDLNITFVNGGNDPCALSVAVASQTPGSQRILSDGADQLIYTVKLPDGSQFINDDNSPLGAVSLPGGPGKQVTLTLKLEVPAGQIAPTGTFTDLMTIRTFDVTGAPVVLGGDHTETVFTAIAARAQVNIAGTSGSFGAPFGLDHIDFGNLSVGEVRNAYVQVRSTGPVTITVLSANNGSLLHTVLGAATPGVPYSLNLDSQNAPLRSGSFSLVRSPPITLDGISYPMSIQIVGPVNGLVAGQYEDTLTINVIP